MCAFLIACVPHQLPTIILGPAFTATMVYRPDFSRNTEWQLVATSVHLLVYRPAAYLHPGARSRCCPGVWARGGGYSGSAAQGQEDLERHEPGGGHSHQVGVPLCSVVPCCAAKAPEESRARIRTLSSSGNVTAVLCHAVLLAASEETRARR